MRRYDQRFFFFLRRQDQNICSACHSDVRMPISGQAPYNVSRAVDGTFKKKREAKGIARTATARALWALNMQRSRGAGFGALPTASPPHLLAVAWHARRRTTRALANTGGAPCRHAPAPLLALPLQALPRAPPARQKYDASLRPAARADNLPAGFISAKTYMTRLKQS